MLKGLLDRDVVDPALLAKGQVPPPWPEPVHAQDALGVLYGFMEGLRLERMERVVMDEDLDGTLVRQVVGGMREGVFEGLALRCWGRHGQSSSRPRANPSAGSDASSRPAVPPKRGKTTRSAPLWGYTPGAHPS